MCFSAAANFVGSGVLGVVGVVTLTQVKHRRELLFAALPTLFAIHQFIEGFVWRIRRDSLACCGPHLCKSKSREKHRIPVRAPEGAQLI